MTNSHQLPGTPPAPATVESCPDCGSEAWSNHGRGQYVWLCAQCDIPSPRLYGDTRATPTKSHLLSQEQLQAIRERTASRHHGATITHNSQLPYVLSRALTACRNDLYALLAHIDASSSPVGR